MSNYYHNVPGPLYDPPHHWPLVDFRPNNLPGGVALGLSSFPVSSGEGTVMPDQPEVANSSNHLAAWQSSADPLTRDLLDMGGATFRVNGRCNSAAGWERVHLADSSQPPGESSRPPPNDPCAIGHACLALVRCRRAVGPTDVTKQADFPASPRCTISPLFSELTEYDCLGGPADTTRDSEAFSGLATPVEVREQKQLCHGERGDPRARDRR